MFEFKLPKKGVTNIVGFNNELESMYIDYIYNKLDSDILVVTSSLYESNMIYNSIISYNENTYLYPMDDFVTSEASISSPELMITRLETLNNIVANNKKKIIITNLMGILRYLPDKSSWRNSLTTLKTNTELNKDALFKKLIQNGYSRESIVTKTGEIASRGYILDLFPINEDNPIRIEFFGDTIESIRRFDVNTQLSKDEIFEITIYPFSEFIIDKDLDIEERKQKYLSKYIKPSKIDEYLNNTIIIYNDFSQINNAYINLEDEILSYKEINNEKEHYMHTLDMIKSEIQVCISKTSDFIDKKKEPIIYNVYNPKNYNDDFESLNKDIIEYTKFNKTVIICLRNDHQINNISKFIDIKGYKTNYNEVKIGKLNYIIKNIRDGFVYEDVIILGEKNLFKNIEFVNQYKSKFKYGTRITNVDSLKVGDYVVHNSHGIGIYTGIVALKKGNTLKDYLKIEYKDKDKLYIPVEKIDLVSKYSSNESSVPKINKLGSVEWEKTKLRIKNRLKDIASELIRLAAERKLNKGFAFEKDSEEQAIFESEFMYEDTVDQAKATNIIKKAMESEVPMDMLLCGDVGYGKTEVAFRAIFKAICSSKQIAYLCPTTILSNQQYNSALNRFKNFPVNIGLLNRFTTKKEASKTIENLKKGRIDILFGTHRILSKDIEFKNLGLLVIDEEQRFGVEQKEQIKKHKSNVDVLTLSATPIPRTLQMSMVGLRDLALIETPPGNRYPIQTYVLEENAYVIKDAIYKEISRDGQVYILCNKISDFENKINEIKRMIPEIKIGYAHGKMTKIEIEDIMMKFVNKEFNVLLCTTIIETGIDIANVNTLIIIDADNFGLSQLYQIRGRVGRTNKIAYAYLMYNKKKVLSDIATKRLTSIKEFAKLGSGFSIAMRDLSIRGAGDILGGEQSGFIDSIGIELYTKMLNNEVSKLKGIEVEEDILEDENPSLNVNTHIEDKYVDDDNLKIEIHRMINKITSIELLNQIKEEIEDRFGKLNEDLIIYMYEELFESMKKEKGIESVVQTDWYTELVFDDDRTKTIKPDELFVKAYKISKNFKLSYINRRLRLKLLYDMLDKHWIFYIIDLLNNI